VVPVRLAAKQLKKIAELVELKGVDRSTVLRELIDIGLESGQVLLLLRRPGAKGRTAVDRVIRVVAANERVKVTQAAAMRAAVGRGRGERPARRGRACRGDGGLSASSEAPTISVSRFVFFLRG
jgi:hypothetical protein